METKEHIQKEISNAFVLEGYFFLRLLKSEGSYIPDIPEVFDLSRRYLILPSEVYNLYLRATSLVD